MSNHALITLTDALRARRGQVGTRWRRLTAGRKALLVMAYTRKVETYADLATGFGVGTTTVFRYVQEAIAVLAALAPSLPEAITAAGRKAFVILDDTLLRIDRVGMGSRRDRPYYSGPVADRGVLPDREERSRSGSLPSPRQPSLVCPHHPRDARRRYLPATRAQ